MISDAPNPGLPGLHHVTAIAGDPRENRAFYTETLGLRFVKRTVNFDDVGTYHLYYGDEGGTPGTALTFFPFEGARRGRVGASQTGATAFAVPEGAIDYWIDRFDERGVDLAGADRGVQGVGTVHHVAFRTADEESQRAWRERLTDAGLQVTEVKDRQYFRSIYFREPGGVLVEIATEGPGFTRDEDVEELGEELKLPPWLENDREAIAADLPEIDDADAESEVTGR